MTRNPARSRNRGTERTLFCEDRRRIRHWDDIGNLILDDSFFVPRGESIISPQQYCLDTVGYRNNDNPLFLSYQLTTPYRIFLDSENIVVDEFGYTRQGDTSLTYSSASFPDAIYPENYPDDDIEFVTRAAAASNPSSAKVSGAVFMAELRELPSLFQSVGHNLAKFGANEYLKFQYGWRPFVKDLRKMFAVISRIESRMNVLNKLHNEGLVRHNFKPPADANNLKVYSASFDTDITTAILVDGAAIGLHISTEIKTFRWADILWIADPPDSFGLLGGSNPTNFATARNAVYGLNLDGPSLWAAMPWSWLIDWVHNCSDYIESQNNTVGAKFGRSVLMRHSEVVTTATPFYLEQGDGFSETSSVFVSGRRATGYKERILGVEPGIVQTGGIASILGDDFKLSILEALAIQRIRIR